MTKICPFCGGNKLRLDSKARKVGLQEMYDGYKAKYTGSVALITYAMQEGQLVQILLKQKTYNNR